MPLARNTALTAECVNPRRLRKASINCRSASDSALSALSEHSKPPPMLNDLLDLIREQDYLDRLPV
jgi:hypothetical protein